MTVKKLSEIFPGETFLKTKERDFFGNRIFTEYTAVEGAQMDWLDFKSRKKGIVQVPILLSGLVSSFVVGNHDEEVVLV